MCCSCEIFLARARYRLTHHLITCSIIYICICSATCKQLNVACGDNSKHGDAGDDDSIEGDYVSGQRIFTWLREDEEVDELGDGDLGDDEYEENDDDEDGFMEGAGNEQQLEQVEQLQRSKSKVVALGKQQYVYDSSDAEREAGLREYRLNIEHGEIYDEALEYYRRQYARMDEANGDASESDATDKRKGRRKGRKEGKEGQEQEDPEMQRVEEKSTRPRLRLRPRGDRPRLRTKATGAIIAGFGLEESNKVCLI